ncbi:YcaO-like family protein [Desulfurivibrio dismutans]|uniref:YcaO-like family protein n=1 Tax=Desulfurivibrio dismutans TaxID=1398908 RepID=UPI0023D9ACE4|nr:YcaO-like family protein [Desulfurivibrio alkaliphilus]MDF1615319.1 YcaO-like family protein [Desulfurivibrio alkaliphilus]
MSKINRQLPTPSPITYGDCLKSYTYDQDKACTPEETITKLKKKLAEVKLDILNDVRRVDTGRLDIPVYFSVCGREAFEVIRNKKQLGKGCTPEQSQASACMELIERFSFFDFNQKPANFLRATYAELKDQDLPLLPLKYLLQSVHDENTSEDTLARLIADIPIRWTWATHLNRGEMVLIPYSWFYAINEFNGPSAGNSYEEAILQGLCEVVERHVSAVVTRQRLKAPKIDPASITDPVAVELLHKFTRHGIRVFLNDFTLDTGIPTVAAMAMDPSTFPDTSEIVYTAGTTPEPNKALIRALTEVAQMSGDFHSQSNYEASGLPKPLSLEEVDYIVNPGRTVQINELPDLSDNNMKAEIDRCLAALSKLGMEVFLVNTMHQELQIPAVYTIIPGADFRERSNSRNVGLFAAKLAHEQISPASAQIEQLEKMGGILPEAYFIEFFLGKKKAAMGLFQEAMDHFQRSLQLHPEEEDFPYIYAYMGECLKDMGSYREAIEVLRRGLEHDEERQDIHNMLGFCHYKQADYENAVTHFARAIDLEPGSAIDFANLGINLRKLGRHEEAAHNLKIAITMDPYLELARTHLDEMLQEKQQTAARASLG